MRWLYTLSQFVENYGKLKKIIKNDSGCKDVTWINKEFIETNHIQSLILDFDGVLSFHGSLVVDTDVKVWLEGLINDCPAIKIYILSNKPLDARITYFKKYFPCIQFIVSKTKKPYPDGINYIVELSDCEKSNTWIVDDRLATGVLAGVIAGINVCYIHPPRARATVVENFFKALRVIERCVMGKF
ncbi:MAG: HAD family hydrolase [Francisellaceae bacterium]|jgi:predicted HAD superfamily phosphohydrolase YqeG|nr:HAD family hydrolase [Francisellaceae bacterium]MBT6538895.1 HAD family hydrolase [Francisellaceae bacterium]